MPTCSSISGDYPSASTHLVLPGFPLLFSTKPFRSPKVHLHHNLLRDPSASLLSSQSPPHLAPVLPNFKTKHLKFESRLSNPSSLHNLRWKLRADCPIPGSPEFYLSLQQSIQRLEVQQTQLQQDIKNLNFSFQNNIQQFQLAQNHAVQSQFFLNSMLTQMASSMGLMQTRFEEIEKKMGEDR